MSRRSGIRLPNTTASSLGLALRCVGAALLSRFGLTRFIAFLLTTRAAKIAAPLVRIISRGALDESGAVSNGKRKGDGLGFWVQEKFALSIASQLGNLPLSAAQMAERHSVCDESVVILSARTASEHRRKEHTVAAARMSVGSHVVAEKSNHWIMQDEPQLVMSAIENFAGTCDRSCVTPTSNGRHAEEKT